MINVVNLCIILHVFLFSVGKLCFQKFIYMYLYLCAWINLYNLWSFLKSDGCLNIASQTAGPNGLTSFVDSWVAGGCVRLKYGLFSIFLKYWKNSIFIHGQRQDLHQVHIKIITQELLVRFASNFDSGTRESHGNVLSLVLRF